MPKASPRRLFQFSLASLLLLMTIAAIGVGVYVASVGRVERATLEGLVTMRGEPLVGTITLTPAGKTAKPRPLRATINDDGRFSFPEASISVGAYSVSIDAPPGGPSGPIPAIYNRATVLAVDVLPGANEVNFELR
ncbi:MAG: hypothetical protein KY475_00090 [Planctomycetes bacterium]|nr:hypothetical protein [Planctomycetota bacterium]